KVNVKYRLVRWSSVVLEHVHFHIIPKPNPDEGLQVGWPVKGGFDHDEGKRLAEALRNELGQ
ncbi:MAG: hypothetical protein AAFQ82_09925, partial [Myxococcota bacterium]